MKEKIISIISSLGGLLTACIGGSCGLACLAGGCCGSFALFGLVGISGSALSFLEDLKPLFLGLTIVTLAWAFYKAYRPEKKSSNSCCSTPSGNGDNACCKPPEKKSFFQSRTFLWLTVGFCLVMWTYSYVSPGSEKEPNASECCPNSKDSTTTGCCPG